METNKKLLAMLVEKTFKKHGVKNVQSNLTKEQKVKLRSIVKEMEQEVKAFVEKAEKKEVHQGNPQKSAPSEVNPPSFSETTEGKPYVYRKKNRKNR
ncbi:hypothetical protein [Alteribacter keqinensis]|uniref:Spore coat protein n=1 Tax=Alteribacter keqinensis TaxID=2483800 RepID=A0A3M7TNX0_9BACI|nr:hypothetical protein [Alteribacter keqinensis]RNA66305.1 hypothetical protein EBO34_19500 [Alteribacter keqinensis]